MFELESRYTAQRGSVYMTGIHAIVRALLDQRRADVAAGLRTAGFVSGYPGSPLAGLDREIGRQAGLLDRHGITHVPGLNEELAATSVWGSQLTAGTNAANVDGVTGAWYGKAPGVDRAADALRHANYSGTGPLGGAVAFVGEDPSSKSSTLPSGVAETLAALCIPTFAPGNLQELIDLSLHAFACSRASGTWSAVKVRTDLADGSGSVTVGLGGERPSAPILDPDGQVYRHVPSANLNHAVMMELERSLFSIRLPIATSYGTLHRVNAVAAAVPGAWLGIAADGQSYLELLDALADLGLDAPSRERLGIRLLKIGMPYPLDREMVRDFAAGLDTVLVVESKLPFVERAVRDALYDLTAAPRVIGKRGIDGSELLSSSGELFRDDIARAIAIVLRDRVGLDSIEAHLERLAAANDLPAPLPEARTPFFCSGCPHNISTQAPDGVLVGAGIGCHSLVVLNRENRGEVSGITQMGGEGAQWIGMAPFTEVDHFVQNVGDGTFHHSASLAVRAAVAAGVNITFKLLYNDAIAMTGGQDVAGLMSPAEISHELAAEGVVRIVITAEEPKRYQGISLAANAEVRDRAELLDAQRELAGVAGVTVLIHDQRCAAEKRRLRKGGKLADPPLRVHINERVCEGCGDCGRKSSCLSVRPVETEFGRKTQIHQGSCNKDYSCLDGDCPAFVTVIPGEAAPREAPTVPIELPEPELRVPRHDFTVRMPGIGGTGVVTVAQILGVAAMIDGKHVWGMDQTGLSQKGGPVTSDLRIADHPIVGSNRLGVGGADLLLGFDLLGAAAPEQLRAADPRRTLAVISTSAVPTGEMVVETTSVWPEKESMLDRIDARTRKDESLHLDAQALSQALFDDHMPANLLLLGAAYQRGAIPVAAAAIHEAIELNRVEVATNLLAFEWGRAAAIAPDLVDRVTRSPTAPPPALPSALQAAVDQFAGTDIAELVAGRAADLAAYQSTSYARGYLDFVLEVKRCEAHLAPGREGVTESVARHLHKLMAYKDEYEVARLHLDASELARMDSGFGASAKVWWHLRPPLFRTLGLERKIRLGPWFGPVLRALRAARRLRGTPLDPFGYTRVRRLERRLVDEYRSAVSRAVTLLSPQTYSTVLELCELPDRIRGYEAIKLESAAGFDDDVAALLAHIGDMSRSEVSLSG